MFFAVVVFVFFIICIIFIYVHIARWELLTAELIRNGKILLLTTASVLKIVFFCFTTGLQRITATREVDSL